MQLIHNRVLIEYWVMVHLPPDTKFDSQTTIGIETLTAIAIANLVFIDCPGRQQVCETIQLRHRRLRVVYVDAHLVLREC